MRGDPKQRKPTSAALADSEASYRDIVENVGDLIQNVAPDGRFSFVNTAWKRALGYDDDDLRTLIFSDIVRGDYLPHCQEIFQGLMRGETYPRVEVVFKAKHGGEVLVEGHLSSVVENGKTVRTRAIFRDITARRQAEEHLRRSEERYRDLIEGSIQGIYIARDWRPLFANQALADILGYERPEDIVALTSVAEFIDPRERQRLAGYREARMRGEPVPSGHEARYRRRDGSQIWLESINRIVEWDGAPAIQATVIDITARKQAEQALRESEKRFKDFAGVASDWFWQTGPDSRFTWLSEGHQAKSGDVDRVIGMTRWELAAGADDEETWVAHRADLEAHRTFRDFVYRLRMKNGDLVYRKVSGVPVFGDDGEFQGYRGTASDVTRVKELERELLRQERLATLGRLTDALSHELRTPLSTIRASIFSMAEKTRGQALGLDLTLDRVERSIERCIKIIDELSRYMLSEDLMPITTRVDDWLESVAHSLALPDGVVLSLDLASGVKTGLDQEDLRRALGSVVQNACEAIRGEADEAAPYGTGALTLRSRVAADSLRITVADDGPGIAGDILPKVFEPLFSTKSFGLGLGLPMVKQIMERHGGAVEIESRDGRGTCVSLVLPIAP